VKMITSEKWKPALQILADLFAAEKLNPDFSLQNGTDIDAAMSREQYGIYFGDATAPDGTLYNSVQRDNNAVWQQYPIYDTSGNPALVQVETRIQGFNCVNKNSKNPEALMLIANIYQDLMQGVGISYRKYHDFVGSDNNNYDSFFYPFMGMLYPRVNNAEVIAKAKKTGDFSKLTGEQLGVIDKMNKWVNNKDVYGWRLWAIDKPGGSYETNNFIRKNMWVYPDRGWGPETATWISKGPDLYNISNQYFTKIVRGDLALEQGFTEWVNYFNSNGGLDCTNEINDWWKNGGGKDAFDNIKVQIN